MKFLPALHDKISSVSTILKTLTPQQVTEILNEDEISLLFQKAVLSGEYTFETEIESTLRDIRSNLTKIHLHYTNNGLFDLAHLISSIKDQYFEPFYALANDARENFERFFSGQKGLVIDTKRFQHYRLKREIFNKIKLDDRRSFSLHEALFQINILTTYMDESLESNKAFEYELSSIQSFLSNTTFPPSHEEIARILLHKTEFLEFKIRYRDALSIANRADLTKDLKTIKDETNVYKAFFDKTIKHYDKFSHPPIDDLEKDIAAFKANTIPQNIELEAFHHLNRYISRHIKDDPKITTSEIQKLKANVDEFILVLDQKSNIGLNTFNKVALMSVRNALRNTSLYCQFRISKNNEYGDIQRKFIAYVSTGITEPNIVDSYIKEAIDIAGDKNSVRDYYCYIQFLKFLNEVIEYLILNHKKITNVQEIKNTGGQDRKDRIAKLIDSLELVYKNALDELRLIFDIHLSHKARSVYVAFADCKTLFQWPDDPSGVLFLHSSYTLPNNPLKFTTRIQSYAASYYAQINSLRNIFENDFTQYEIESKLLESQNKVDETKKQLRKTVDTVKETKNEMAQKIKETEFKTVQIVAMFVSIATFVLINVKIFDGKSGLESFAIILGLAACFFIFNLFFHFIVVAQYSVEENGSMKIDAQSKAAMDKVRRLIWIPIAFGLLSLAILSFQDTFITTSQIKTINTTLKNDTSRLTLDSLKFRTADSTVNLLQSRINFLEGRIQDLERKKNK